MPGCYDDPAFLAMEQADPTVLEDYAAHVLERPQGTDDQIFVRKVIERAAARIIEHLPKDQLQRRCVEVGNLLLKGLEQHGVWAVMLAGSVRYVFAGSTGLAARYTWAFDDPDFPGAFVGHAWLAVPPYGVVDCTAHFQAWDKARSSAIPSPIIEKGIPVQPEEKISIATHWRGKVPRAEVSRLRSFWQRFPPLEVKLPRVTITYQPHAIKVPDGPLSRMTTLISDPVKLFNDLLK